MKFARYLQETQTPEWKKAYIDYRGLKKRIAAIRRAQDRERERHAYFLESESHINLPRPSQMRPSDDQFDLLKSGRSEYIDDTPRPSTGDGSTSAHIKEGANHSLNVEDSTGGGSELYRPRSPTPHLKNKQKMESTPLEDMTLDSGLTTSPKRMRSPEPPRAQSMMATGLPRQSTVTDHDKDRDRPRRSSVSHILSTGSFRKLGRGQNRSFASRGDNNRLTQLIGNPLGAPLPMHELFPLLSPVERSFFTALDSELEKIESFYLDREKEMKARSQLLKDQLGELSDHRKLFYAAHPENTQHWTSAITPSYKFYLKSRLRKLAHHAQNASSVPGDTRDQKTDTGRTSSLDASDDLSRIQTIRSKISSHPNSKHKTNGSASVKSTSVPSLLSAVASQPEVNLESRQELGESDQQTEQGHEQGRSRSLDPDDYLHAKKKLKKAVLEHYRGLEMLRNYRILNLTGFRKALKKFEKVTKIPALQSYMSEKVDTSAFASDTAVAAMIKEMEETYALRFERGDKKKAMGRLRAGTQHKSHHSSAFRSGIFLGLAIPALVSGLYQSFQQHTRDAIAGWDALLFIYGILLIPTLFSLLVGINLLIWSQARINYVFIFELDIRTRLDHREYFETPAMLFATLCYAFWLSFSRIGLPTVSPTVWPLVWLAFTALVIFNPFPLYKPSRYWLIRNVGKLLISGTRRVEFTDFWMGDQFCSLIFTLSNLYLFVCVYIQGFNDEWRSCNSSTPNWPVAFVLAALPLLVRVVQSIRRYVDSRLITHLINGGKYASGIITYFFYFHWRHQGGGYGADFALWCLCNAIYSTYACSWDLLMDWSFLRTSPQVPYPLLRQELVYSNNIPMYYLAMISNVLIRFIWVFYIPTKGPNMLLRTFIGGVLEMLRRWQWNFYRLENEHLGNMDQYRVTREVPLPYSLEDNTHDDDDGDVEMTTSSNHWLKSRLSTASHRSKTFEQ